MTTGFTEVITRHGARAFRRLCDLGWVEDTTMPAPRMTLKAYVCEGGCVRWRHDLGTTTAYDVFIQRPDPCRIAVVQVGEDFWVIDLLDLEYVKSTGDVSVPRKKVYSNLDAAVAAAALTY